MSDEQSSVVKVPFMAKLKFLGIGALVGLMLGGVGAGKVWWDQSSRAAEAEASLATASASGEAAVQGMHKKLAVERGKVQLLRARLTATYALREFNRQNYGSAADQVKTLREQLSKLSPEMGVDASAVSAISDAAGAITIDAAGDQETQRHSIVQVAKAIDALL